MVTNQNLYGDIEICLKEPQGMEISNMDGAGFFFKRT